MLKYSFIHKSQSNIEMKKWGITNPLNKSNQNSKYHSFSTKNALHRTLKGRNLIMGLRTDMKYRIHKLTIY